MQTIFLALGQYSHFSDVLRGKLIRRLAEQHRVVVLTPVIDEAVQKRDGYFSSPHVRYEKLGLSNPKHFAVFDKYLRVPLVRSFDHLVYMRYFYRRDHSRVRKLLMAARRLLPRWLLTTDRITRWEVRRLEPSPVFQKLVREHDPVMLLTATPGFTPFEAEMIIFAKRLGIPTLAVDINYDNPTSNAKLMRKTDALAVWNGRMQREARELHGYPDAKLPIVGCLRFDHYFTDWEDPRFRSREEFLRAKNLDPEKKTVVYIGPTPSNYPPRRELAQTLVAMKRDGALAGNPNLFIRVHPIDHFELYREFLDAPGVHIERSGRSVLPDAAGGQKVEMNEADLVNMTETLVHADVVVNFASTVIIEACLFDRPVINVAFPDWRRIAYEYEYNKGLVDTGAVPLAHDPGELSRLINRYLEHPELERGERSRLAAEYAPFRDGKTWERTAEFVEKIIAGSETTRRLLESDTP